MICVISPELSDMVQVSPKSPAAGVPSKHFPVWASVFLPLKKPFRNTLLFLEVVAFHFQSLLSVLLVHSGLKTGLACILSSTIAIDCCSDLLVWVLTVAV